MKYILNVINILVYINSASNNTSSASVKLSCVTSACAGYGNYILHTLEHFHLNIIITECTITQLNITLVQLVLFDAELI